MKLSILQSHLARALAVVGRAVSPRSTLPVLANVLLATDEGRLRLAATNLEIGIVTTAPALIEQDGAITVPARLLADLVSTLPNETVYLSANANTCTLTVKCGHSETSIKGIDAQEFPPMAKAGVGGAILKMVDYKRLVAQVTYAASSDEARPVMQGVLMDFSAAGLTASATDGFRVTVKNVTVDDGITARLIVPARALTEFARIADGEDVSLIATPDRGQVVFRDDNTELTSQLIDGNFPDFKQIIPKSYAFSAAVSRSGLLVALRQAEIIARSGTGIIKMHWQPGESATVTVTATSEESGTAEAEVPAKIDGPELDIAFNVKYLKEGIEAMTGPEVHFLANKNNSPAALECQQDQSYTCVIMPMFAG